MLVSITSLFASQVLPGGVYTFPGATMKVLTVLALDVGGACCVPAFVGGHSQTQYKGVRAADR